TYFVPEGMVSGIHGLKRAKPFVSREGKFQAARFQLRDNRGPKFVKGLDWAWTDNPFVGSDELNGLKILMMLMSNWDAKDSRDGKGSNTAIYLQTSFDGIQLRYAFDDWGATFGKWGGFFSRDKWNADGYSGQTRSFVRVDGDII